VPNTEQKAYRSGIVSYVDILGFKKLVEESKKAPEMVAQIGELLQAAKDELHFNPSRLGDSTPSDPKTFVAQNFSDLTVRVRFVDNDSFRKQAVSELDYLAWTQYLLMMRHGLLIRGGVCQGEIVASTGVIYGPALVKAYALESEYAVYPRIVVDRELASALFDFGEASIASTLKRGEDGAYFVDYLFAAVAFDLITDEWRDARRKIDAHRRFVEKEIGDKVHAKPERVKQKLMWLALYHNATLEKVANDKSTAHTSGRLEGMEIPSAFLRF
jgi:hypothetical protein